MGQKVHPYGFRLGIIKDWKSQWFADKKTYPRLLLEDVKIRKFIKQSLSQAAIANITISRASNRLRINIHSARPGVIIGRRGAEIDRLKEELQNITDKEIFIDITDIKNPTIEAQLISENIAFQIEKRIPFRRVMKKAVQSAMNSGAGGIKVRCSGRLGGAEIARTESYKEGKVPLHTLKADIDYGFTEALTTYGCIGIKVWVFRGYIIHKKKKTMKGMQEDGVDAQKG